MAVWCGTSVGAINATLLASLAHRPGRPRDRALARDAQAGRDRADRRARRRAHARAPRRSRARDARCGTGQPARSVPAPAQPRSLDRLVAARARNVREGDVDAVTSRTACAMSPPACAASTCERRPRSRCCSRRSRSPLRAARVATTSTGAHRSTARSSRRSTSAPTGHAYRIARGHAPYKPIAYALVAPGLRGAIGRLADTVFERRLGGLRSLRDPDYAVISRVLGGRVRSRGELLSFLPGQ